MQLEITDMDVVEGNQIIIGDNNNVNITFPSGNCTPSKKLKTNMNNKGILNDFQTVL